MGSYPLPNHQQWPTRGKLIKAVGIETLYLTSGYSKGHQKETKRLGDQFLFGEPPFQFLAIKQVFPQMMLCLTSGLIFTSDQLWVTRILQCSSLGKARLAFWILFERTKEPYDQACSSLLMSWVSSNCWRGIEVGPAGLCAQRRLPREKGTRIQR